MTNSYVSTDPSVVAFVNSQNSGSSGRGVTGPYYPALLNNGIAGTTTDNVIGFSSLTTSAAPIAMGSGFNAVIIDGGNSATAAGAGSADNYSFTVDTSGAVILTDSNTGSAQTVTGVSFLVFEGAARGVDANGNADYAQMYFIGGSNQTEVTELYNAAFGRQPDLGGVEYYMNQLQAGTSFTNIANEFMASPEFQARFGASVSDNQFITNLYENILHRAPGTSELAYYAAGLQNAEAGSAVNTTNPVLWSRAQELLNFANSPENQADTAGFVINTAGTASGGFVYSTPAAGTGNAQQLLAADSQTGNVDTGAINVSGLTIKGTGLVDGLIIAVPTAGGPTGDYLGDQLTYGTILLSSQVPNFVGENLVGAAYNPAGLVIYGSPQGHSNIETLEGTVTLYGAANNVFAAASAPYGNPFPTSTSPVAVNGFTAQDTIQFVKMYQGPYTLLTASPSAPISGASLQFTATGGGGRYAIYVGDVKSGSAADVAAVAQTVYAPSDAQYESAVFYGRISTGPNTGGTALWEWGSPITGATTSADVNGNHLVEASEFYGGAILVGVAPTSITSSTFHSY